jgi:hypothetical protein
VTSSTSERTIRTPSGVRGAKVTHKYDGSSARRHVSKVADVQLRRATRVAIVSESVSRREHLYTRTRLLFDSLGRPSAGGMAEGAPARSEESRHSCGLLRGARWDKQPWIQTPELQVDFHKKQSRADRRAA